MNENNLSLNSPAPGKPRGLGPITELSPSQEQQILSDVRGVVFRHYMEGAPETKSAQKQAPAFFSGFSLWRWMPLAASGVAALGAMIWFGGFGLQSSPPALLIQGQAQVTKGSLQSKAGQHSSTDRRMALRVAPQQSVKLQQKGRWKVRAFAQAELSLHRKQRQHHLLHLRKGAISVHVIPRQIKRFEVVLPHYHVWVKGTRFSIKRASSHWRIEMTRGRVALSPARKSAQAKKRRSLALVAGQGAMIRLGDGKVVRYKVPPKAHRKGLKRVAWWLKHDKPALALHWIRELAELSPEKKTLRADALQSVAEYLRTQKRWAQVIRLLIRVHHLQVPGRSEFALPESLSLCRRLKKQVDACLPVYRLSLQQQSRGPFAEHSIFWLAVGLSKQTAAPSQEVQRLLWRYVREFPQGEHMPRVVMMLKKQQSNLSKNICKKVRALIPPKSRRALWWRRVCPSAR